MKIAISSDNHLDVNRQDPQQILAFQSNWLTVHHVDYYLFAGDLFNNFQRTADYMTQLDTKTPSTAVFYVAGNHDMLGAASEQAIESFSSNEYLHNQYVDLPHTNWRVIGNNGWYDYSFSMYDQKPQKVARWKNVFWLDSAIPQDKDDKTKMTDVLAQTSEQLTAAQRLNKAVLYLTHFAPRHELLEPKPAATLDSRHERIYQMINAMMGSDRLGDLLESSPNVKAVFYGHLHHAHRPLHRHGLVYLNQAVGVKNKRHNEWQRATFEQQWVSTMRVLVDPNFGG